MSRNFKYDPVIKFVLCNLSDEDRIAYLPSWFHVMLKASALNKATFQEANDWSCAAVWMHPGESVDNPWTMIPAGLFSVLWKLGLGGCKVSF